MKRIYLIIPFLVLSICVNAQIQRVIGDSVVLGVKTGAKISLQGKVSTNQPIKGVAAVALDELTTKGQLKDSLALKASNAALALKANLASPTFTGTVSGITKAMVALGNVDNTSDANKPISTATQAALNLKANDNAVVHLSGTESITGAKTFTSDVQIPAIPVNATSAASKNYIDNLITGITWKAAVRVAATTSISLSGTQTIDGIVLVIGDRVLVKNQTAQADNGIYLVATGAWTRALDADTGAEIETATVAVTSGTVNRNTQWTCTATSITIGTTPITFGQISGAGTYAASTGLTLTGNVFAIDGTVATLSGTQTLTNKSISGASNTITNIPQSSVTSLTTDLAGKAPLTGGGASGTWGINITGNAANVTGMVAIANGGTGSATKNFVDLTTAQTIGGGKTLTSPLTAPTLNLGNGASSTNIILEGRGSGLVLTGSAYANSRFLNNSTDNAGIGFGYVSGQQKGIIYSETGGAASSLGIYTNTGSAWAETISINGANQQTNFAGNVTAPTFTGNLTGTSTNVTGIVAITNGGTGSSTKNFVDLTTPQTIAGVKTFSADALINGLTVGRGGSSQIENVALGANALVSNTGGFNTAIGRNALTVNTNGSNNTVVGSGAGQVISTGNTNTILGSNTGVGIQTGSGNTLLGQNGTAYATNLTNNIIIAGGAGVKAQHDGTNWTLTGGTILTGSLTGTSANFNNPSSTYTEINGSSTTGQSNGLLIRSGTNSSDFPLVINNKANNLTYLSVRGDGNATFSGSVTTGAPSGGAANAMLFGDVISGGAQSGTLSVQRVSIGGVVYYVKVSSSFIIP